MHISTGGPDAELQDMGPGLSTARGLDLVLILSII